MSPVSRSRKKSKTSVGARQAMLRRRARAAYLSDKDLNSSGRYWHGGRGGLEPGTILIPRAVAEHEGADLLRYEGQAGYELGVTDASRVYFSTNLEFARAFAAGIRAVDQVTGVVVAHGGLYEVEPIGEIEKDPDFERGSWCAPRARIVSVHEPKVRLTPYEIVERTGPHTSWLDGSPVYTPGGRYIPSPEQMAGPPNPLFAVLYPWTPVEFVNAWLAGKPSGDRPSPGDHSGVMMGAVEAGALLMKHVTRAAELTTLGVEFSSGAAPQLDAINRILDGLDVVRHDQERGVIYASSPHDGVIGALVVTAARFGKDISMFIDALAVAPAWRRRGLGSVLLRSSHQLLPSPPIFAAGHCDPDLAPFFAQAGYTVLRPGVELPLVAGDEPKHIAGLEHASWFYRQGPI